MSDNPDKTSDVRRCFVTSFKDKCGTQIKEGDIIREIVCRKKEKYHYEEKFDMMGNGILVRVIDDIIDINGWCMRQIKWSKDCLIAERIEDSGNISTSYFEYLNDVFESSNVEVVGSIY